MLALSDFRYAVRLLAKKPGFTILTTLVMATGISLCLFIFSFFNTTKYKDLPFEDGERLVVINKYQKGMNDFGHELSLHDYHEMRNNIDGLTEFGAFSEFTRNVTGRDSARRYLVAYGEENIFRITRTQPILGRDFTAADNIAGAENVAVIGYDMWQNLFAGDTDILGEMLRIKGESHRIIGVMPEGYTFPTAAEMWLPMREDATRIPRGEAGTYYGIALLEDGYTIEDIDKQLEVISARLAERYPETNTDISAYTAPLQSYTAPREAGVTIYVIHSVTVLVLILAAVNVGNLLLSRAVERGKEIAIRAALGAPRGRLISQMLWESVIICTVGGIVGLLVVAWGLEVVQPITASFFGGKPPFWWQFGIDAYTMKLFVAFVIGTIFVTGFLPAWKSSGGDFNAVLRDGTRGALGKKAGKLNKVLVVSEIFLSMAVLIAAGAQIASAYIQAYTDYGAKTENILTARVQLPDDIYDTPEKQSVFMETLQSRLNQNTAFGNAMLVSALPSSSTPDQPVAIEGREYGEDSVNNYPRANPIAVTPGSLANLDIELKDGRYFSTADKGLGKKTAIVTESFADMHFNGASPIGQRIRFIDETSETPEWLTIVGVVEHTIQGSPNSDRGQFPSVFRPYSQSPRTTMTIALEMKSDAAQLTQVLRKTIQSIDPNLPIFRIETYREKIAMRGGPTRLFAVLFLLFGASAAVLAATGIYGVMSNTISQRTQEIGVKRALGAKDERVRNEFMKSGLIQLLCGAIPGAAVGYFMGQTMMQTVEYANILLGIVPVTVGIIAFVVMLSTYIPTKRALRMEPSAALRYE